MNPKVTIERQIVYGKFVQCGRGGKTVRLALGAKEGEVGFATTTYNGGGMSDDMMEYCAERIQLAMTALKGLSNEDIKKIIARR